MLTRTPIIALFIAGIISFAVVYFFQIPSRPFTTGHLITLYVISYLVALGIALYLDPKAAETTRKLSQINFYEEK